MLKNVINITDGVNLPAKESFSLLNTNIGVYKKSENIKLISIVSFDQGEGKTTIAINLAMAAAKSGASVLFVDADLRKPGNLKANLDYDVRGLTDLNEEEIDNVICDTNIQNLKYITSGTRPVDPAEYLSSPVFDTFLEYASRQYDQVFIDTSFLGSYADSAIIASKSSGVLVVARFQKTSYKNIERIKWQMANVGANIIGVVVNLVNKHDFKSYFIWRKPRKIKIKSK